MTEIYHIFLQLFLITIFFCGPFTMVFANKLSQYKLYFFDLISLNILINSTILLLCSFFELKILFIFVFFILVNLFIILINYNSIKQKIIKFKDSALILFFLICLVAISFYMAFDPKLSWDGIEHWFWKALNYNQNGSYENLKEMPLAYYPHLGSYIWGFFWSINPLNYEYLGRLFYIFIFLIPFFSASYRLGIKNIEIKLIIILILIILNLDRFLLGGYQEYFLFYLFYSFGFLIYIKGEKDDNLLSILLFISATLMIWVKQEGLFYLIILSIIYIFSFKDKIIKKVTFIFFAFFSIFIMIEVREYFHGSFNFNEEIIHEGLLKYLNFFTLVESIFFISIEILKAVIKYPIWILIGFFLILDLINNKKYFNIRIIFFILFFGFIFSIYLQTNMDMRQLMPLTLDRIVFHGSGFYLIFIFLKIKELCFNN